MAAHWLSLLCFKDGIQLDAANRIYWGALCFVCKRYGFTATRHVLSSHRLITLCIHFGLVAPSHLNHLRYIS